MAVTTQDTPDTEVITQRRLTAPEKVRSALRYVVIIVVCVIVLFPVYWMILSTFQPEGKTLSFPPPIIPAASTAVRSSNSSTISRSPAGSSTPCSWRPSAWSSP